MVTILRISDDRYRLDMGPWYAFCSRADLENMRTAIEKNIDADPLVQPGLEEQYIYYTGIPDTD